MDDDLVFAGASFDDIKYLSNTGNEFWYARELGATLGYDEWSDFYIVIKRAILSCRNNGYKIKGNFNAFSTEACDPNRSQKHLRKLDYRLTVYACYLISQKADLRRKRVAAAQAYFTMKLYPELFVEEPIRLTEMTGFGEQEEASTYVPFVRKKTRGFKRQQARQHTDYKSYEFDEYSRRHFIKKQLLNSRGNVCEICGEPITDMKDCTIDHIRPISKGGVTDIENCQLAHKKCNIMKGNSYGDDNYSKQNNTAIDQDA